MQEFLKQHLVKTVIGVIASTITGGGIYLATSLPNKSVSPVVESSQGGEVMSVQIEEPEETPTPSPTPTLIPIKTSTPTPTITPTPKPNTTQNTESNNPVPTNTPTPIPQQAQSATVALEACFTHDAHFFYEETHLDASCSKGNIVEYKWVIGKTPHYVGNEAYGKNVTVRFEIPANIPGFGQNFLDPSSADVLLTVKNESGETREFYQRIGLEVPENHLSEKWW